MFTPLAFALGVLAGVAGAWWAFRRVLRAQLARARAAERRASSAERLAEIGAMTGGLAHEIKNPLSTIGLNAQLLAEGLDELDAAPDTKGRLQRRLASLRREVDRLRDILTDFLAYAGELRLDTREADLNAVVDEMVDFFLPQAQKQGVRLRAELAPGPLRAALDVNHAKQAILNLMLNATQAMAAAPAMEGAAPSGGALSGGVPSGGASSGGALSGGVPSGGARELILRTARAPDPDARPCVALHVIDTGPGIDPATRAKLFRPYFTTKSGGTGLGLPTTRRIVEAHAGRIDLHTEPGRGSDFTLYFPDLDAPAPAPTLAPKR